MPKYDVYITRSGYKVKRDRSPGDAVNGPIHEALYNVSAKTKERAEEKVRLMQRMNTMMIPRQEVKQSEPKPVVESPFIAQAPKIVSELDQSLTGEEKDISLT